MSLRVFIYGMLFSIILSGCTTSAGIAEFHLYKKAFDESAAVSTALIDKLAASEREIGRQFLVEPDQYGIDPTFNPTNAVYFTDTADPPLAAEYRRALLTINKYNEIMLAYATGHGFDDILARIQLLANEVTTLGGVAVGASTVSTTYTAVAAHLAKFALAQKSRVAFQEEFKKSLPLLLDLLNEMRNQTPEVFRSLTFFTRAEIEDIVDGLKSGDAAKLRQQHMGARILLSKWIVLLDKQEVALRATLVAIENPRLGVTLSGTAEAVIELSATVKDIRVELAKLQ